MTSDITIYDSAAGVWPLTGDGEGQHIAAYVDNWGGWWDGYYLSNFLLARERFPKAWIVQICSLSPLRGVAMADCEEGCLSVAQVCGWANTEVLANRRPTIYGSASTREQVTACLAGDYKRWKLGEDIDYFMADPDGDPSIPAGCVGKQFHWGPNVGPSAFDTSVALASWAALKVGDPA